MLVSRLLLYASERFGTGNRRTAVAGALGSKAKARAFQSFRESKARKQQKVEQKEERVRGGEDRGCEAEAISLVCLSVRCVEVSNSVLSCEPHSSGAPTAVVNKNLVTVRSLPREPM